jgi:predicted alpha/beta hydrolase
VGARNIVAADGVTIIATFHGEELPEERIKGRVLLAPAMGVAQYYYTPFATWLARQGYLVATFDYRGIGQSRPRHLRGFKGDILAWAQLDCAAMLEGLGARAAGTPLYWIGHSVGSQVVPFVPDTGRITKVLSIASGSGYWRENAHALKRRAVPLWYLLVPVSVALCGYFPGRRLRVIGDLPKGVVLQWRRWCLHPDYALSEGAWARERYAAFSTPIAFFSFTDDEYMSEEGAQSMSSWYANAPQTHRRISPQDLGVPRIGHLGFFRPDFERLLWQDLLLPELS